MRPGTEPPYAPGAESVLPTEPVLKPCTCNIRVKPTSRHLIIAGAKSVLAEPSMQPCTARAFHAALHT